MRKECKSITYWKKSPGSLQMHQLTYISRYYMNSQNRGCFLFRVYFGRRPRPLSKQRHIKEQETEGHSVCKTCIFLCYQDKKGLTPGRSEIMQQLTGLNPITDIRHLRASSWTHLKAASLTKISEHQLSERPLSLFSHSGCPPNPYPSAVTHTHSTSVCAIPPSPSSSLQTV